MQAKLMAGQDIPKLISGTLGKIYEPREAKAIARMLLEVGFGITQTSYYTGKIKHFSEEELARLHRYLRRLEEHEPIQYVLGQTEFDGLTLSVHQGVLIPRPETQQLVAWVASEASPYARILDVGTGSGCIALALANRMPLAEVAACDNSTTAIHTAQENARRLRLNVYFSQCDMFAVAWEGTDVARPVWDVVVSNPPYVCQSERATMSRNVLDYEPDEALFVPDDDALRYYRALVRICARRMRSGGALYVEINQRFGRQVADLFTRCGLRNVELRKDFFGNDRMVKGICP